MRVDDACLKTSALPLTSWLQEYWRCGRKRRLPTALLFLLAQFDLCNHMWASGTSSILKTGRSRLMHQLMEVFEVSTIELSIFVVDGYPESPEIFITLQHAERQVASCSTRNERTQAMILLIPNDGGLYRFLYPEATVTKITPDH